MSHNIYDTELQLFVSLGLSDGITYRPLKSPPCIILSLELTYWILVPIQFKGN